MNTHLISKIEKNYTSVKHPRFKVGDTVSVHTIIREGARKRVQVFTGLVISIKGSGTRKMFTVRKISYGVGVEKIFPLYSPNIEKIEVTKFGKVRRAKLYYLRDRVGKKALKVKPGSPLPVIENEDQSQEVLEETGQVEVVSEAEMDQAEEASDEEVVEETATETEDPAAEAEKSE